MKSRKGTHRFQFEYEYYDSEDIEKTRMLYIKIFTKGPVQTQLWLNPKDKKALKEILEEENDS